MNRSSLVFILLATALIGGLFGLRAGPEQVPESISPVAHPSTPTGPVYRFYNPLQVEMQSDEYGDLLPYALGENYRHSDKQFTHERLTVSLPLDGGVEYKAVMDEGDSIVYRWKVSEGQVYFDFHGHPNSAETKFFNRYREGESDTGSGSIVAAFKGHHGWFWLNISDHPIVIELEVAGFYDRIERVAVE